MSYRHNISITDKEVEDALLKAQNMSKFVEECVRFYLLENEKHYAEYSDIDEVENKIEILNRNYLEVKDILNELVRSFMR